MNRSALVPLLLLCFQCIAHRNRVAVRLQSHSKDHVNNNLPIHSIDNNKPTARTHAQSIPQSLSIVTRSDVLRLASAMTAIFHLPVAAQAAKGAFELDAEYYWKALTGDKKQKTGVLNRRSPLYVSPRKLDAPFATSITNCVLEAAQTLFGIRKETVLEAVSKSQPYSVKYFKLFAAMADEDISDQFYFDMLLFLYYREIGQRIESSPDRVRLRDRVGDEVLNLLLRERSVVLANPPLSTSTRTGPSSDRTPLDLLLDERQSVSQGVSRRVSVACANMPIFRRGVKQILDRFTQTGLLAGYVFDDEDLGDVSYLSSTFEEV